MVYWLFFRRYQNAVGIKKWWCMDARREGGVKIPFSINSYSILSMQCPNGFLIGWDGILASKSLERIPRWQPFFIYLPYPGQNRIHLQPTAMLTCFLKLQELFVFYKKCCIIATFSHGFLLRCWWSNIPDTIVLNMGGTSRYANINKIIVV